MPTKSLDFFPKHVQIWVISAYKFTKIYKNPCLPALFLLSLSFAETLNWRLTGEWQSEWVKIGWKWLQKIGWRAGSAFKQQTMLTSRIRLFVCRFDFREDPLAWKFPSRIFRTCERAAQTITENSVHEWEDRGGVTLPHIICFWKYGGPSPGKKDGKNLPFREIPVRPRGNG